jgi:AraC family transcriptional regulator
MEQRPETVNDYQQRIISVLVYIDQHKSDSLSLEDLASIACFSPFHFHRLFHAFVGESLHAYIKRLRLEQAALQLKNSDQSVTDIAFNAGFDTPGAFAKAFRERFGITPTGFRTKNLSASNGQMMTQSEEEFMKPEVRQLADQTVMFVRRMGNYEKATAEAWQTLCGTLPEMVRDRSVRFIGISHDNPSITEDSRLRYDACITVKGSPKPKGEVGVQVLKGGKYAVFLHQGSYEKFNETYDLIFSEWLPRSGYRLRETPCFELYLNDPDRTKPEDLRTEIYVPIE